MLYNLLMLNLGSNDQGDPLDVPQWVAPPEKGMPPRRRLGMGRVDVHRFVTYTDLTGPLTAGLVVNLRDVDGRLIRDHITMVLRWMLQWLTPDSCHTGPDRHPSGLPAVSGKVVIRLRVAGQWIVVVYQVVPGIGATCVHCHNGLNGALVAMMLSGDGEPVVQVCGPAGPFKLIEAVAIPARRDGIKAMLRVQSSVSDLLGHFQVCERPIGRKTATVFQSSILNPYEVIESEADLKELEKTPTPVRGAKDILISEGLVAFRNDAGKRRHGALTGLEIMALVQCFAEHDLRCGDPIRFWDKTQSALPQVHECDSTTTIVLPERRVRLDGIAA